MSPGDSSPSPPVDWTGLIPPDARVVFLVGCPDPLAPEAYRRRNPPAYVVALEDDPALIEAASNQVDRLIVAPVGEGSKDTPGLAPASVDCLVINTPLDRRDSTHLTLTEASRLLDADGMLLAVAVGGRFDEGYWRAEFDRAGLELIDFEPQADRGLPFDDSPHHREPGVSSPESDAALSILRGVRGGRPRRRLWLQTLAATRICSRIRTEEPDEALRTIPGVRTRTDFIHAPQLGGQPELDRVLIRQRNILGRADLTGQRALREAGYLIVCEWDDDPAIFPQIARSGHLTFRACHCVQTSTEPLAEVLRDYHPHVQVFPNQVSELPPPRVRRPDSPATIVFAALNREPDWPEIVPALRRVLDEFPGRVRLEVLHDRAFFDAVPTEAKTFRPFLPIDQYVEVLRRADIALLPLTPTRFNQCKSDLKYLECAANGVVCLASPTVYGASIRHGETGMIYGSAAEFEALLRRLIADPMLRDSLADAAYRDVARHRMLGSTFRERHHWYAEMSRRLPELDRELCDRVPEVA